MLELTCLQCGGSWKSRVNNPVACPKKGCRSRIWYREKKTTRTVTEKMRNHLISIAGNGKGRKQTQEHIFKRIKSGVEHGHWKGDLVGYKALHSWVRRHLIKPTVCQECKKNYPYDVANISQEYKRDLSDWEWLCRICHMIKDGRLLNLHKGNLK